MKTEGRFLCFVVMLFALPIGAQDQPGAGSSIPEVSRRATQIRDWPGGGGAVRLCAPDAISNVPAGAIAIFRVPGPADNTRIHYEIRNVAPGGEAIRSVVLNGFAAASGEGVCFLCLRPEIPPAGGDIRVDYPSSEGSGVGPSVLSFVGFEGSDCAALAADASIHEHEGEMRVKDLEDTRVEVVFDDHLRGSGTFRSCGQRGTLVPATGFPAISCTPEDVIAVVFETM